MILSLNKQTLIMARCVNMKSTLVKHACLDFPQILIIEVHYLAVPERNGGDKLLIVFLNCIYCFLSL